MLSYVTVPYSHLVQFLNVHPMQTLECIGNYMLELESYDGSLYTLLTQHNQSVFIISAHNHTSILKYASHWRHLLFFPLSLNLTVSHRHISLWSFPVFRISRCSPFFSPFLFWSPKGTESERSRTIQCIFSLVIINTKRQMSKKYRPKETPNNARCDATIMSTPIHSKIPAIA